MITTFRVFAEPGKSNKNMPFTVDVSHENYSEPEKAAARFVQTFPGLLRHGDVVHVEVFDLSKSQFFRPVEPRLKSEEKQRLLDMLSGRQADASFKYFVFLVPSLCPVAVEKKVSGE